LDGFGGELKLVTSISPSLDSKLFIFCYSSLSSLCIRFDFEIESFNSYDLETGLSSKYCWASTSLLLFSILLPFESDILTLWNYLPAFYSTKGTWSWVSSSFSCKSS